MTVQDQSVVVLPPIESNDRQDSITNETSITNASNSSTDALGSISKTIGTGENAKNSIIWMTITWSFYIAGGITIIFCMFLAIAYYQNRESLIIELMKHMFSIWSIFTPLITLSLGYAFGRNQTN